MAVPRGKEDVLPLRGPNRETLGSEDLPPRGNAHELALDDDGDDWSSVKDPAERRRRQNRIHQRTLRQKKALEKKAARPAPGQIFIFEYNDPHVQAITEANSPKSQEKPVKQRKEQEAAYSTLATSQEQQLLIQPAVPYRNRDRPVAAKPIMACILRLSPDHQLITLIQYNVFRALMTNFTILHILDSIPYECGGIQTDPQHCLSALPLSLPATLEPTALQVAMPHERWIDAVPNGVLRDNLIRYAGDFDSDDLCDDLYGGLFEGFNDVEKRGIIVWSDPWQSDGWELSEGFARKWRFLLKGCDALVEATNRWRELRGEDRLVVEA